jgi:ubiquinone/menaquinone biosynthesis C-methylase UbiE
MNRIHNAVCSSGWWSRKVEDELLPWGLAGVEPGEELLEFGPGFGATTRVLAERPGKLSVLELEPSYCERLERKLPANVSVTQGDATKMPFEDGSFSGVVCFTMLHHLPSPELQDRAFAEAHRVLRPGGVFAGTDSIGTGTVFKLIHIGDTLNPIDPASLPARLEGAGFTDVKVSAAKTSFRFRATRPA